MKAKRLMIMLRLALLFLGFSFVCLGAYVKSLDSGSGTTVAAIFSYMLVVCGILMLLMGGFWSICLAMKSSWHRPSGSRRRNSQVFIYTVDRPNFYPPPYEECQARTNPVFTINHACLGMAPPLYTTSSEVVNEDFSHEQPPSYQQALQGHSLPSPGQLPEAQSHKHDDHNAVHQQTCR